MVNRLDRSSLLGLKGHMTPRTAKALCESLNLDNAQLQAYANRQSRLHVASAASDVRSKSARMPSPRMPIWQQQRDEQLHGQHGQHGQRGQLQWQQPRMPAWQPTATELGNTFLPVQHEPGFGTVERRPGSVGASPRVPSARLQSDLGTFPRPAGNEAKNCNEAKSLYLTSAQVHNAQHALKEPRMQQTLSNDRLRMDSWRGPRPRSGFPNEQRPTGGDWAQALKGRPFLLTSPRWPSAPKCRLQVRATV